MQRRVAVFVDGENIGSAHASAIQGIASERGEIRIARVYGNIGKLNGWQEAAQFSVVHSGTGKNATDILLSLDALELALDGRFDICVVASSDRDFSHLAVKLRERGTFFVGAGEAKSPPQFVQKCSEFRLLGETNGTAASPAPATPPRDDLDTRIIKVVEAMGSNGSVPIPVLNAALQHQISFSIAGRPERTWKSLIQARSDRYEHLPGSPPHLRIRAANRAA